MIIMPLYEFSCSACGHTFSELRKMGDYEGVVCPQCGSDNTKKLMSAFASSSKGSDAGSSCAPSGGG